MEGREKDFSGMSVFLLSKAVAALVRGHARKRRRKTENKIFFSLSWIDAIGVKGEVLFSLRKKEKEKKSDGGSPRWCFLRFNPPIIYGGNC